MKDATLVNNVSMDVNRPNNIIENESMTGGTSGQTVHRKVSFRDADVGIKIPVGKGKHDAHGSAPAHRKGYARIHDTHGSAPAHRKRYAQIVQCGKNSGFKL